MGRAIQSFDFGGFISAAKKQVNLELATVVTEVNQIASTLDRSSLLHALTHVLRKAIRFDRAHLALYNPQESLFRIFECQETVQNNVPEAVEIDAERSVLLEVVRTKEPLLCEDVSAAMDRSDPLLRDLKSAVIVPIRRNGSVLGALVLGSRQPHAFSSFDVELVFEVARHVVFHVENILAQEEIARLRARLEYEYLYLKEEIFVQHHFKDIVGQSLGIRRVLKGVESVAPTDAGVLLYGEPGTGKDLILRSIHELSPRKDRPLVRVNCASIPADVLESELFGHRSSAGAFELANGGTIFLDEVADLPLNLQERLLSLLQEREFEGSCSGEKIRLNVRLIAATSRDLERLVSQGKFRADLYYRLNVFPIRIPPLRERKEDIPLLAKYFVMQYGARFRKSIERIPQSTIDALLAYSWPGNIRELEQLIERAVILCQSTQLEPGKWLPAPQGAPAGSKIPTLDELEKEHLLEILQMTGWQVVGERGAAKLLGMKPATLEARIKKLGVHRR